MGARRGVFQNLLARKIVKETAHRGQGALHAAHAEPFVSALGDKSAYVRGNELGQHPFVGRAALMFVEE